jgi:hypothetical protein
MTYQSVITDLIRTGDELHVDIAREDLGHPELPGLETELVESLSRHGSQSGSSFVCGTHRHPMRLLMDGGQLAARHVNPIHEQINHGTVPEHEACQDRILRMARTRGLDTVEQSDRAADDRGHSARISDVMVRGERTVGFEAVYSGSAPAVKRKFDRGTRDGVTVYFGGPRERSASKSFVDRVPYGTYNDIPVLEIRRGRPMPIISGLRRLRQWRCASDPASCPHFGKPTCCTRTWHSDYGEPEGQVDQDDVVYDLAVGTRVPVKLPAPGGSTWQIVPAKSVEIFLADGGTLLDTAPCVPAKQYVVPFLTRQDLTYCAYAQYRARDGVRLYACGPRCPIHTPAAMAGEPEPDELLARHRSALPPPVQPDPNGFPYPPGLGGPCVRCATRHHRYGPGGQPLCPRCRP